MTWTKNDWGGWRADGLFVGQSAGKWWGIWVQYGGPRGGWSQHPEVFGNAEEAKKFAEGLK